MNIHLNNGKISCYDVSSVDSITFSNNMNVADYDKFTPPPPYPLAIHNSKQNALYKKHFTAIGDSHTNIGSVWRKLAEITGATYHHITTNVYDGETFLTVDGEKTNVKLLMPMDPTDALWYNEVALAIKSSGVPMDYVFFEDTHLGALGVWEVNSDVKPIMIESNQPVFGTIFSSRQKALDFVSNSISEIVESLNITETMAGFIIKYNTAVQSLQFCFTDGADTLNKDSEFSLYFGDDTVNKLTIYLKKGMSLEECVYSMNDYAFNEYTDWFNSNKGIHGYTNIDLTYTGTLISNYPLAHLVVTDGSNLGFYNEPSIKVSTIGIPYLYYGWTKKGLQDATNWRTYGGVARWVRPNVLMGTIEYLKDLNPSMSFVCVNVPAYRSQNITIEYNDDGTISNDGALNPDGSINLWAILNSTAQINNKKSAECIKEVASYYNLDYLDIFHYGEITPRNAYIDENGKRTPYYEWYNSHCTSEGYSAWARSIMYLLK